VKGKQKQALIKIRILRNVYQQVEPSLLRPPRPLTFSTHPHDTDEEEDVGKETKEDGSLVNPVINVLCHADCTWHQEFRVQFPIDLKSRTEFKHFATQNQEAKDKWDLMNMVQVIKLCKSRAESKDVE